MVLNDMLRSSSLFEGTEAQCELKNNLVISVF